MKEQTHLLKAERTSNGMQQSIQSAPSAMSHQITFWPSWSPYPLACPPNVQSVSACVVDRVHSGACLQ